MGNQLLIIGITENLGKGPEGPVVFIEKIGIQEFKMSRHQDGLSIPEHVRTRWIQYTYKSKKKDILDLDRVGIESMMQWSGKQLGRKVIVYGTVIKKGDMPVSRRKKGEPLYQSRYVDENATDKELEKAGTRYLLTDWCLVDEEDLKYYDTPSH